MYSCKGAWSDTIRFLVVCHKRFVVRFYHGWEFLPPLSTLTHRKFIHIQHSYQSFIHICILISIESKSISQDAHFVPSGQLMSHSMPSSKVNCLIHKYQPHCFMMTILVIKVSWSWLHCLLIWLILLDVNNSIIFILKCCYTSCYWLHWSSQWIKPL